MIFNINDDNLLKEFDLTSQKLLEYKEMQYEIKKKIDLTTKLINSQAFEESVIEWARTKQAEVVPFYYASQLEEESVLYYGSLILSGMYLNFNGKFLRSLKEESLLDSITYLFDNELTGERRFVSIREVLESYNTYISNGKDICITIRSQEQSIQFPLIHNNVHKNSDGTVYFGDFEIDKLACERVLSIINQHFIIKDMLETESKTVPSANEEKEILSLSDYIKSAGDNTTRGNVLPLFRECKNVL